MLDRDEGGRIGRGGIGTGQKTFYKQTEFADSQTLQTEFLQKGFLPGAHFANFPLSLMHAPRLLPYYKL